MKDVILLVCLSGEICLVKIDDISNISAIEQLVNILLWNVFWVIEHIHIHVSLQIGGFHDQGKSGFCRYSSAVDAREEAV